MPNGGSDNCATCWYNSNHEGTIGFQEDSDFFFCQCLLRNVRIEVPIYHYCANHPYNAPKKVPFPIGPIYKAGEPEGLVHPRYILIPSPDTEDIRLGLLELLVDFPNRPLPEYHSPTRFEVEVIRQLGEFGEHRAIAALRRVLRLDPLKPVSDQMPEGELVLSAKPMDRQVVIGNALEALAKILGQEALSEIEPFVTVGLEGEKGSRSDENHEKQATVRFLAVKALALCGPAAESILRRATNDPVCWIAQEAEKALDHLQKQN